MNSQKWSYLDDANRPHMIQLWHLPREGKLLVQVNGQTVIATVHARSSGRWSFLIEDELFDIVILRRGLEYFYGFEINRKADTERNRLWKKGQKMNFWLPIGLFFGAIFFAGFLFWGRKFWGILPADSQIYSAGEKKEISALQFDYRKSVAVIKIQGNSVDFSFQIAETGEFFSGKLPFQKNNRGEFWLPTGFQLETGDEFFINFSPGKPSVHQINFNQPTENQLLKYIEKAAYVEAENNPSLSKAKAVCRVLTIEKNTGLRGLLDIIHQKRSPKEDKNHNSETYSRLIRSKEMAKFFNSECWDK